MDPFGKDFRIDQLTFNMDLHITTGKVLGGCAQPKLTRLLQRTLAEAHALHSPFDVKPAMHFCHGS